MFDNLKSKLKGLFKKAPAEIAEEGPAEIPAPPVEEKPVSQPAEPPKQLSRKEQLKLEKEAKKAAKKETPSNPEDMVSDKGGLFSKKI